MPHNPNGTDQIIEGQITISWWREIHWAAGAVIMSIVMAGHALPILAVNLMVVEAKMRFVVMLWCLIDLARSIRSEYVGWPNRFLLPLVRRRWLIGSKLLSLFVGCNAEQSVTNLVFMKFCLRELLMQALKFHLKVKATFLIWW